MDVTFHDQNFVGQRYISHSFIISMSDPGVRQRRIPGCYPGFEKWEGGNKIWGGGASLPRVYTNELQKMLTAGF